MKREVVSLHVSYFNEGASRTVTLIFIGFFQFPPFFPLFIILSNVRIKYNNSKKMITIHQQCAIADKIEKMCEVCDVPSWDRGHFWHVFEGSIHDSYRIRD